MTTGTAGGPGDFESLARQYWNAWGESMRQAGMPPAGTASATTGGVPGWQDAVDWWSKLAHGGRGEANAAVDRFNAQAKQWYGQMQQVAAQFAGQQASASDITSEWKRALGAIGENPFPLPDDRGQGSRHGQGIEDASPTWRVAREGSRARDAGVGQQASRRSAGSPDQAAIEDQQRNSDYKHDDEGGPQDMRCSSNWAMRARGTVASARALFDL